MKEEKSDKGMRKSRGNPEIMRLWRGNLTIALKEKKVKQVDLAKQIGVTSKTVNMWLNGHSQNVSFSDIVRISHVLKVDDLNYWMRPLPK